MTDDWRDISAAPKDGTRVLLGDSSSFNGSLCIGWWETQAYAFGSWRDDTNREIFGPTHWMPLPSKPETTKGTT